MEVIFHGRPKGQDIKTTDKNEDDIGYIKRYLDNHYGEDVSSVIVVDFVGQKRYYTYLRQKNFFEINGQRSGSYFAITIVLQGKIYKVPELYDIFDKVFDIIIKGRDFIKKYQRDNKDGFCYVKENLEYNWDDVVEYLNSEIKDSYIQSYEQKAEDTEFTTPEILSLDDVDSPYYFKLLPRKLLISRDYPCFAESAKLAVDAYQKNKKELDGSDTIIVSKDGEIKSLQDNIAAKRQTISNLEGEKNKLQEEIKRLKEKNDDLDTKLKAEKQRVEELNKQKVAFKSQCDEYFKDIKDTPVEPEPDNNSKSFIKDNFLMILVLFMQLLMFIVLLSKSPDSEPEVIEVENDKTIAVTVSRDTAFTIATETQKININVNVRKDESIQTPILLSNDYKIDLSGYNGTRVIDQLYYLSLINTNKNASAMNNCVYEVIEGDAKILENKALAFNKPDDKVVIRATSGDKKYYVERVFEKSQSNK